jgi:hypothetical protein
MKFSVILSFSFLACTVALGQNRNSDSLRYSVEQKQFAERSRQKVDSIQRSFNEQSDSLKSIFKGKFGKMDSAQSKLEDKLDSVRFFQASIANLRAAKLDSIQLRFHNRIDSSSLSRQTSRLSHAVDSIKTLRDSTLMSLNRKMQVIKDKTVGKLNSLDLPPQVKSKLSDVTGSIKDYRIPGRELNLSSINPNTDVTLAGFDNLNLPSSTAPLPGTGGLESIKGTTGSLPDVAGKAGGYSQDLNQLGSGNLSEVKELPEAAESKAEELSGVQGQTKQVDKYKDMAGSMQNPDSLKVVAKQEIKQVAVNHFAGREQQLKQAMETISKYKNKYSSMNSLADIKKRPPNAMKGKPFIERFIPGIAMQIQKKGDDFMVDFNPYAGYRFTGRITAGVGWNQRVAYNLEQKLFNPEARVFGPRVFGEFKLWKGFSPRLEGEVMNTKVPPATITPSLDPGQREWVWGAFIGLKKEYRFVKNIKGTALIMTRVFNRDHKSPYADVLNVRFGFEFPMKKKLTKD